MARLTTALLAGLAFTGGCCLWPPDCRSDPDLIQLVEKAKVSYDNQQYGKAAELYEEVVTLCPDHDEATVGLASSLREEGYSLLIEAWSFEYEGDSIDAREAGGKAGVLFARSEHVFRALVKWKPDDDRPYYGLGLLWYLQATSPWNSSHTKTDEKRRERELEKSIEAFGQAQALNPGNRGVDRWLGLALLKVGRLCEAISHLKDYHAQVQNVYTPLVLSSRKKKGRVEALFRIHFELGRVRKAILEEMRDREIRLGALRTRDPRELSADERETATQLAEEVSRLESLIRGSGRPLAAWENRLVRRCLEYFEAVNQGKLDEVEKFLWALPQEELEAKKLLKHRLNAGTRYREIQVISVELRADTGTVQVNCEIGTTEKTWRDSRVTLRWGLREGIWMLFYPP